MKKTLLLAILLLVVVNLTYAQDFKFGKVSKPELEQTVCAIDSSANAAILYKKRSTYFDYSLVSGVSVMNDYQMRIKIYNKEGFDWATKLILLSRSSNSVKEIVTGLKAYTYNLVDGKIVKTKLEKSEIFKVSRTDNIDETKFTMPNLKEGCVIEWKYKITSPYYSSIDEVVTQYSIPIIKADIRVKLLEYFKFSKRTKGFYYLNIKESHANNSSLDTRDKLFEIKVNNMPAIKEEAYVDNIDNYRSGVIFEVISVEIPGQTYEYFATTWQKVAGSIFTSQYFEDQLKKKNVIKDDIEALRAKAKTVDEKIDVALAYVKEKVKWNDLSNKYSYQGIRMAHKKGTGNSADINLLLVVVLNELGLNASAVLSSTVENGVPLIPTIDGLNYVTALVEEGDRKILLDATEKYSGPNILPSRAINWDGMVVRSNKTMNWIGLKPKKPVSQKTIMQVKVDDMGEMNGMCRTSYFANSGLNYRKKYNDLNEDDLLEKIESKLGKIEINSIKVSNKEEFKKPIVETLDFSSEELTEVVGDKIYFKPLLFNSFTENPFKLEKREYPVNYGTPLEFKNSIIINIPEGYEVESLPEQLAVGISDKDGVYIFKATLNGNSINIISSLKIQKSTISALKYNELKEFYNQIVKKNEEQIVLKKV